MSNMYNVGQGPSPSIGFSCVYTPDTGTDPSNAPTYIVRDAPMVSVNSPFQPCGPSSCPTGTCCNAPNGGNPPAGNPPPYQSRGEPG